MARKTEIDVRYTGPDGKEEIINFADGLNEIKEVEIELEPKPKPTAVALDDGTYEVDADDEPSEKPERVKETKSPDTDEEVDYKDKTKKRIDQLLAKQHEAREREQYLLNEMQKLKSNLSEMTQVKSEYEVSAVSERKAALSVAQKALSAQAADALSSGEYGEFQRIDNDLKKIAIDLHQIDQAESRLKSQKEAPPRSPEPYTPDPRPSYPASREYGGDNFMDSLSRGDDSPGHVMQLSQKFEDLYDRLPPQEQKWLDERSQAFDLNTTEGQRRLAAILGTAAHLQKSMGEDHPDYLRELDNRLLRKNLLKPEHLDSLQKKAPRAQPVMTEASSRAPKKSNTIKLNASEVDAARMLIGHKGITTDEQAFKEYVKNKMRFERSISNI